MEELLRQILEELRADDSRGFWLEALRIAGPLVGGALVAASGFFAVYQQNKTQRETLDKTTRAQADQQRMDRLTEWRQERYGELLAALGEVYAAIRGVNAAVLLRADNRVKQERIVGAANHLSDVYLSGRILQAAGQVADGEVAELTISLANEYYRASRNLVELGTRAQLPRDEEALREAFVELRDRMNEMDKPRYELNRRIEELISAGR